MLCEGIPVSEENFRVGRMKGVVYRFRTLALFQDKRHRPQEGV